MNGPRRRPGRLWLFFWGRKRRGFPGLLTGTLLAALGLALIFRIPGGAELSRWVSGLAMAALALLILGSLGAVAFALWRPRRGRR